MYTDKSDIYSMAIIFWEIVTRCLCRKYLRPYCEFSEKAEFLIFKKVAHENLRPTFPPTTPSTVASMIKLCWDEDPYVRPPCESVISAIEDIRLEYGADHKPFDACIARKKF